MAARRALALACLHPERTHPTRTCAELIRPKRARFGQQLFRNGRVVRTQNAMNRTLMALALSVSSLLGCAADVSDDGSPETPHESEEVFALPSTWAAGDVVSGGDATDGIEKVAGSSVRNGVGPTIYSKNFTQTLSLPHSGGAGVISSVRWTWGLSYRPLGLVVSLCRNTTSSCIDVTNTMSGSTTAWNTRPRTCLSCSCST